MKKRYGPLAMDAAAYLGNMIPSAEREHSPFKLYCERKPSLKHIRIFGCKAPHQRDKLDEVARLGTFVGYSKMWRAWRVLIDGAITESTNIEFDETRKGADEGETLDVTDRSCYSLRYLVVEKLWPAGVGSEIPFPVVPVEQIDPVAIDGETPDRAEGAIETEGVEPETVRRSTRIRNPPTEIYKPRVTMVHAEDPQTYRQAMGMKDAELWEQAKNAEYAAISSMAMGAYELCDAPEGRTVLPCKGVLSKKRDQLGNIL
jgi:hypothetical protein